jgi:ABC-type Mn2+/Zn2+ transport system permease subunit
MLEPFLFPFVQRSLAEIVLLSLAAGLLGSWVGARGLAFFTHAVGHGSFPGLVLAGGLDSRPSFPLSRSGWCSPAASSGSRAPEGAPTTWSPLCC